MLQSRLMRLNRCLALFIILVFLTACSPDPTSTLAVIQATEPPTVVPTTLAAWPVTGSLPTPAEAARVKPDIPTCDPYPAPPYQTSEFLFPALTPTPTGQEISPTLRSLAEPRGFFIGAATDPAYLKQPEHANLLARQFNLLAVENVMKWEVLHPEPDRYDFTRGDALVDFAQANDMAVYAHVLAWDLQQPAWLTEGEHTRQEWIQILCQHVKTVVGHYRGQIYAWDVVNEAFEDDGTLRDTHWLRAIGPEYIPMAFQWAREADPQALLIYNEHSAEGMNEKSQAVYVLMRGLLKMGIPVDGVGLQMHVLLDGPPTKQELAENMRRLAELGLQVHITEMDVRTYTSDASPAEKIDAQAEVYRAAFSACLEAPNCNVFITWGLTDRYSWIPDFFGQPDSPLLFDRDGQPKPAYQAIFEELNKP